jgi:hypothetical protein
MKRLLLIYGGAIMVIMGIVSFIEAGIHNWACGSEGVIIERFRQGEECWRGVKIVAAAHYPLLICAWSLVILGALTVIIGLLKER